MIKYRPNRLSIIVFSIIALAVIIINTALILTVRSDSYSRYETKITAPVKGVYQGAFANFGGAEDEVRVQNIIDFEKTIGKKMVWAMFSNNWGSENITFPEENVLTIYSLGIVPNDGPRTDFHAGERDAVFTLQRIIDGKFDDDLLRWARKKCLLIMHSLCIPYSFSISF